MPDTAPPLVWLLGRAGAGKSAIAAILGGAPPPSADASTPPRVQAMPPDTPALRLYESPGLDAAGAGGDPAPAALPAEEAGLLLITLRADDLDPAAVLDTARRARARRPGLPVIVAQTRLHDLYDTGRGHPDPYPFDGTPADAHALGAPPRLTQALMAQRALFDALPGRPPRFVPLDFTRPEDDFGVLDYGADALWRALRDAAPEIAEALVPAGPEGLRRSVILPWAAAAAATEAVPLPVLGGLGATSLQAGMVRAIARRHGLEAGQALLRDFVATLGLRFALGYGGRFLARQGLKLAPLWGSAAVAAWSFAVTWALGEAASVYCAARAGGEAPDRAAVAEAYRAGLDRARARWGEGR
jgi:uncharacterized protein (DUF697 family)